MSLILKLIEDELRIAKYNVNVLQGKRDAMVIAAHTFTADDFRITMEQDDSHWTLDDMVGDVSDEDKADEDSHYNLYREAYENGSGVYSWYVSLERRNPATGEFECTDSCCGFFSLSNWPDKDTIDCMMETISGSVPEGIKFADIEGAL